MKRFGRFRYVHHAIIVLVLGAERLLVSSAFAEERGARPAAAVIGAPVRVALEPVAFVEPAPQTPQTGPLPKSLANGAGAAAQSAANVPQGITSSVTDAAATLGRLFNGTKPKPGAPPNYLEAQLALKDLDLGKTVDQLGIQLPFPVTGRLSIQMKLGIPVDTPKDFKTYRLDGTADLPTLSIAGLDLTNVHASVKLANGMLRLEEARADVAGTPFTGQAELRIEDNYAFQGKADVAHFKLDTLRRLAPHFQLPVAELRGDFSISAEARGELRTQKFTASGSAKADDLIVEKTRIDTLSFKWDADTERVRISDLKTKLYAGAVTGDAVLPLRETRRWSHQSCASAMWSL